MQNIENSNIQEKLKEEVFKLNKKQEIINDRFDVV